MNLREYAEQQKKTQETHGTQETQDTQQAHTPKNGRGEILLRKKQDDEETAKERALLICKEYQNRRDIANNAVKAISDGLLRGENPFHLLFLAADCIGALTGETKAFSKIVEERTSEIYCAGFGDRDAATVELSKVRKRLNLLRRTEIPKTANVLSAIRDHEKRIQELQTLLIEEGDGQ